MNQTYLDTARLVTQVAPLVFVDNTFALKGGTAINLFIRDMPRLSVDLDLVLPDYNLPREQALDRINTGIRESAERLVELGLQTHTTTAADAGETPREDVLPALGLTATNATEQLRMTHVALSRVLDCRAAISPEMALRIEAWLGMENGGRADHGSGACLCQIVH